MSNHFLIRHWLRIRRWLTGSEAALIGVAIIVGIGAGLLTRAQNLAAHGMQQLLYGVGINRLSALSSIQHPWKLLALPLGGLVLMVFNRVIGTRRTSIDVVEANALHGGRVPAADSWIVCLQTLISNGFGASVGLEAAYTQAGGALASALGKRLRLRRENMRILVGAGAGAAIGAAFGAPLAGAFYGFEIVIGAYTPAAIAPVMAAALSARIVTRLLGGEGYLVAVGDVGRIATHDYVSFAILGIAMSVAGIGLMRLQTALERLVQSWSLPALWRPVIGGLLLMPIAWFCPQALSSGHGALRLELALHPDARFLLTVFALKILASVISLSFGFRGGLFFASLLLGSLLSPACAQIVNGLVGFELIPPAIAALVGMAALAVTVVGGPMTLSLLVLESTHDFALTGVVIMAVLCASSFARAQFGYSFSTWRLHLRGTGIRSARDQGWMQEITARRLMRRAPVELADNLTIEQLRQSVPLGSTSRIMLVAPDGQYRGMVLTTEAYDPTLASDSLARDIARLPQSTLLPTDTLPTILQRFEYLQVDDIAVVSAGGIILGVLTEAYVRRRYSQELEKQQAHLFGED